MAKKILLSLLMPLLFGGMLLVWEQLTYTNFLFFWAIIGFFFLAYLASIVARKTIGRNYVPFLTTFFVITLLITLLFNPNPYGLWRTWQNLHTNSQATTLDRLTLTEKVEVVALPDAHILPQAITRQEFAHDEGSRAIVPVVSKNYKPGDNIRAYATFTSFVGDMDNAEWFILDREAQDCEQDWLTAPIHHAFIVKDTSKISVFTRMMHYVNHTHGLVAAAQPTFIILNYPDADFRYFAKKIRQTGMWLLAFLILIQCWLMFSPATDTATTAKAEDTPSYSAKEG